MKEIIDLLRKEGLVFEQLHPLEPAKFGIRKRIELYEGVDLKKRFVLVVFLERKSRFLQKDAEALEEIVAVLESALGHAFAKKVLLIKAPLCSKAKEFLQKRGFRVIAV